MKRLIAMAIVLAMGCEDRAVVLSQGDASSAARTTAVDMGPFHLCAISNGNVRCAGQGSSLALGRADGANTSVFLPLDTPLGGLTAVAVGRQFTCVLDGEGAVRCFGTNDHAQLGAIPPSTSTAPIPVVLPGPAASIAAGEAYACAVLRDGSLHCWGTDRECQLANEDHLDHPEPLRIAPGTGFVEVSTGQAHACAIAIDGSLYCWGRNANGQIGAGPMGVQACTPQRVGAGSWRHVSCGQQSTCAIAAEGSLYCWGEDMQSDGHPGLLGLPGDGSYDTPQLVSSTGDWTAISIDTFHSCGLRAGALWCWGRNLEGQLGLGDNNVIVELPRASTTRTDWSSVSVGGFDTCGITRAGELWCAGGNASGELGTGDTMRKLSFVVTGGPS